MATCYPYRVDIGTREGTVAEHASIKTSALQIGIIENDLAEHTIDKNSAVKERVIEAGPLPLFMFDEFKTEIAVRHQIKMRFVSI